ncbi:Hypothetical protein AAM4_1826 [Actinomyces succiniciruminis]|uniref:Uncharacterized protein n=1 Tax=Actinomyces succiniciruminis TaxID=1522002 RepID=A0A1L7RQ46_9ACTO|nr:Hypothetical protein AAM4_1826 [Actinomyces succiniciruminis]
MVPAAGRCGSRGLGTPKTEPPPRTRPGTWEPAPVRSGEGGRAPGDVGTPGRGHLTAKAGGAGRDNPAPPAKTHPERATPCRHPLVRAPIIAHFALTMMLSTWMSGDSCLGRAVRTASASDACASAAAGSGAGAPPTDTADQAPGGRGRRCGRWTPVGPASNSRAAGPQRGRAAQDAGPTPRTLPRCRERAPGMRPRRLPRVLDGYTAPSMSVGLVANAPTRKPDNPDVFSENLTL